MRIIGMKMFGIKSLILESDMFRVSVCVTLSATIGE